MARQIIDNGSFDNDPGAEKIRLAFGKVNDMTEELYSYLNGTGKAAERIVQHIESGESELVEVANSVNATSSLVVPRNTLQIVTFIEPYGSGSETVSYLKKRQYILKRGQGTYGAASLNTVLPTDFIILTPVIIGINDATTFDLGDIEGADISDYVNTSGPYLIIGTTIFETTEGSYVFSGDDGLYGLGEIQTEDENFIPFNSVPTGNWEKIHNLSLTGIDTSGDELTYIAEAVNEFGAFTCDTDEQMIFRTQTPYEDGVIERYYALIPRVTTIGGGATITIPSSYFRPDGQSITGEIPSNILIELGDIGTTDIEDAFNVGDGGDPWDMSVKRFIRATYDGNVTLWSWQGDDGEFGGSGTPATSDDFFLITGQPSPPYSLFKQYATTTAMIADQANQLTKQVYRVLNASDDPNITFPMGETNVYAYYEKKLSVTTGNISDYYLISAPYMVNGGGDLNNVFFATDYGTSDADISLGSTTFGTDSLTGLQEMLDEALTRPILIYWDGKFSVSGALRIHGNTTIIALDGCGAILRNHSSTELIKNYNFADNSETDYAEIVDENISIIGGIWNHNGYNTGTNGSDLIDPYFGHPTNGSAQYRTELGADTGLLIHLISFKGVRNLRIKDAQLIGGRSFAIGLRLCEDFYFDGLRIDFGDSSSRDDYYYDGIHIFGPCRNGFINNTTLTKCKDDAISLVSDGTNPNLTFGAITNINIDNTIFFNNSYGFRFMSGANLLSNINVNGIIGDTKEYIFIFDKKSGTNGNTGTININDVKVAVTGQTFQPVGTCCRVLSKIDVLNITNWTRTDFSQNLSLMKFELGSAVRVFNLTNLTYYLTVSHTKDVLELTNGEIFDLNITNAEIYNNTGSELNFALVGVKGSTLNRLHLKGMTTVQSVRYLVNHTSGICTTIMSDSVRHAGVAAGASFATSGTITNLIIGTWKGAYKLYSGTITNLYGSHFNTLEVYTVSTLPSASAQIYGMIYVSDETGGAVPAFSDGTNWRRVTDRAVVS